MGKKNGSNPVHFHETQEKITKKYIKDSLFGNFVSPHKNLLILLFNDKTVQRWKSLV
jgi:hypothetical protein